MFTMQQPTREDIASMVLNIRDIDVFELSCFEALGTSTYEQISRSVLMSEGCLSVWDHDSNQCLCIGGFLKQPSEKRDIGVCWLVGSNRMDSFPHKITRWAQMFLDAMSDNYEEGVYNVIHRDNIKTKRWLKLLGCVFPPGNPLVIKGEPFTYFIKPNSKMRAV